MSIDPAVVGKIHGNTIQDYVPDYIETDPIESYKDIDMHLERHPITRDVLTKQDERAIKQAIVNLVLLNYYDKPFRPGIGGDIQRMLFENPEEVGYIEIIKESLATLITLYEPRVVYKGAAVNVLYDDNAITITIYFKIKHSLITTSVDMTLDIAR